MRTRHLLIALSISTFTIANLPQYAILAQPNQPEETEPLTTTTAQQIAAKVTVADYDTAIGINPQLVQAYVNRGIVKSGLGDKKGAVADYDTAIGINPQSADDYVSRGIAKYTLSDKKGAIADYDTAISINPQFANADGNRGVVKSELGDRKGAIADMNTAARLFKAQNDRAMSFIQQLSQQ